MAGAVDKASDDKCPFCYKARHEFPSKKAKPTAMAQVKAQWHVGHHALDVEIPDDGEDIALDIFAVSNRKTCADHRSI